jgi:hypothetical protein
MAGCRREEEVMAADSRPQVEAVQAGSRREAAQSLPLVRRDERRLQLVPGGSPERLDSAIDGNQPLVTVRAKLPGGVEPATRLLGEEFVVFRGRKHKPGQGATKHGVQPRAHRRSL